MLSSKYIFFFVTKESMQKMRQKDCKESGKEDDFNENVFQTKQGRFMNEVREIVTASTRPAQAQATPKQTKLYEVGK